jgi:hypothetical protein
MIDEKRRGIRQLDRLRNETTGWPAFAIKWTKLPPTDCPMAWRAYPSLVAALAHPRAQSRSDGKDDPLAAQPNFHSSEWGAWRPIKSSDTSRCLRKAGVPAGTRPNMPPWRKRNAGAQATLPLAKNRQSVGCRRRSNPPQADRRGEGICLPN